MSIRRLGWIAAVALWSGWGCASSSPMRAPISPSCDCSRAASVYGIGHGCRSPGLTRHGQHVAMTGFNSDGSEASLGPPVAPLPTLEATAPYEIAFPASDDRFLAEPISWQSESPFVWDQVDLQELRCRAARQAAVANAIAAQREWFRSCDTDRCSREKVDELFSLAELRERQLAVEQASTLLVNMARLQCQQALLHDARDEIDRILDTLAQLTEVQPDAADPHALRLKRTELDEQQAQLTARSIEIQARLRQLLALPPNDHRPLRITSLPSWNEATLSDDLIATALRERPDLQATRKLHEIDTLGLNIDLSSQMAGIHPLLAVRLLAEASETPVLDFLAGTTNEEDPHCKPRLQGRNLEQEQERDITAEVTTIEGELLRCEQRLRAIAARMQLQSSKKQELERELEIGRVDYQSWIEASLGRLEARSQLIDAVSDLHLEIVKLQSATGTISTECISSTTNAEPLQSLPTGSTAIHNPASATYQRLADLQALRVPRLSMSTLIDSPSVADEQLMRIASGQSQLQVQRPLEGLSPKSPERDSSRRRVFLQPNATHSVRQTDYEAPHASLASIRPLHAEEALSGSAAPLVNAPPVTPSPTVVRIAPIESGHRRMHLTPMPVGNPASRAPDR